MTTYQFEVPDALWRKWKRTVPRDQNLDERIRELLEADAQGRVLDPGDQEADDQEADGPMTVEIDLGIDQVDFPEGRDWRDCADAVYVARDYIHEHDGAAMRELVENVMPEYSLGYDVPDLEPGERYRGGWWRSVVKPGLKALPDVQAPAPGGSEWRPRES